MQVLRLAALAQDDMCGGRDRCCWAEGTEAVEDGLDADDVALGLRHLGVVEEEPAVGGDLLRERQLGGE